MENKKTPFFIFKQGVLEKNYKEFKNLCEKYLEKFIIAYSVKTNSLHKVIEKLNGLGSNFEVASFDEIEAINKVLGIEFEKEKQVTVINPHKNKKLIVNNKIVDNDKQKLIVFNGPCKTNKELEIAIKNKFLINVDSFSEIDKIINILNGNKFDIGLRVSLEESRFGFEENEIDKVIDYCKNNNLKVTCLHFHSGTQLNISRFKENLKKTEKIISTIYGKFNLEYIDLGGGFPDKFQLKNLSCRLDDYFKLISRFNKFNLKIILEPGRHMVSDSFELVTKVNTIKKNFGKNYAILDVGINVLSKITLAGYKFSKIENIGGSIKKSREVNINGSGPIYHKLDTNINNIEDKNIKKEYVLTGPLLFKNDILGKFFGHLTEGDLIKIENVGAYCYNLAWEMSYKKPEILIENK